MHLNINKKLLAYCFFTAVGVNYDLNYSAVILLILIV